MYVCRDDPPLEITMKDHTLAKGESKLPTWEVNKLISLVQEIWNQKMRSIEIKDRYFRHTFGLGDLVAMNLCEILVDTTFNQIMDVYIIIFGLLCSWQSMGKKWLLMDVTPNLPYIELAFIEAISNLELHIVSLFLSHLFNFFQYLNYDCQSKYSGKYNYYRTYATIGWLHVMVLILELQNMKHHSTASN